MIRIITAKYLRTSAKSFPLLLALVVFPLLMTYFMGLAIPVRQPESIDSTRVPVVYYNADLGAVGQEFQVYLTGRSGQLALQELDEAGMRLAREDNAFAVAVFVPPDFSQRYERSETTAIQVIHGSGSWPETDQVASLVRVFTDKINARQAYGQVVGTSRLDWETLDNGGMVTLIPLPRTPEVSPIQYFAASTLVMFLLLAGATGAIRLITEREENTLFRIYAGPVTRNQILLGNLLGQLIMSFLQAALVIFAGTQLFGINWGNSLPGLIGVTTATAFVATALAFLFAFIFNSAKVAGGAIPVLVLMMSFISGGMTGVEGLSPVFRKLGDFTLNKWAINAYIGLMQGQGGHGILTNLLVLVGAGAGFTGLAIMLANRRESFYE